MDQAKYFVYIGVYGEGVYAFQFDGNAESLESIGLVGAVRNPSYLTTDREFRHLYAVSELEGDAEGGLASFRIDRQTGKLHSLNSVFSGGVAPCHLTLDNTGKVLLVANYMTGTVSAYPIQPDGSIGGMSALASAEGSSIKPKRQKGPHAHFVATGKGNLTYVVDLGLDRVRLYRLDSGRGTLTPNDPPFVAVTPGLGPRHFAVSPDAKFVYMLNELEPQVTVYAHDSASGRMTPVQSARTLPPDFNEETTGAEIRLGRGARYLYTSNRGNDSIQVFAVSPTGGEINLTQSIPVAKTPRGFAIDPSGRFLIAGGQDTNTLELYRIDPVTGRLSDSGQKRDVPSPVDVMFVAAG